MRSHIMDMQKRRRVRYQKTTPLSKHKGEIYNHNLKILSVKPLSDKKKLILTVLYKSSDFRLDETLDNLKDHLLSVKSQCNLKHILCGDIYKKYV